MEIDECGKESVGFYGNWKLGVEAILVAACANTRVTHGVATETLQNVVKEALHQDLKVLSDLSVVTNSWNEQFEKLKEERDRLLKRMTEYKKEK